MGWSDDSGGSEKAETVETPEEDPREDDDDQEQEDMTEDTSTDLSSLAPNAMDVNEAAEKDAQHKIMVWSNEGCHEPNQDILMADGSTKKAKDIQLGDELMGPDSEPRTVLDTINGTDEMYSIIPTKGEPFTVNSKHKLSLVASGKYSDRYNQPEEVDVPVEDYLDWNVNAKQHYMLYREGVDFQKSEVPISPYALGILIGDGSLSNGNVRFTTVDDEVVDELSEEAKRHNLEVSKYHYNENKAERYGIVTEQGSRSNEVLDAIRELDLDVKSENKHIPNSYLTSSEEQRLELLAGIIDADGSLEQGIYDWVSASEDLSEDLVYLCRSLGLGAYSSVKEVKKPSGESEEYYRVCISGELSRIPTRLERKQAEEREQVKDVLHTGFEVESVGKGEYYGFTVDGDNRYLMGDFTVTHNCGKTHMGYTMPDPVCILDTEGKADDIAHKFQDKEVYIWQPSDFDEACQHRDEALNFLSEYMSETGDRGTIVVDSMAVMWEWSQYKFIDEWYPNTPPEDVNIELQDWPKIKEYHNKHFRKPFESCDFHVYWTSTRKDDVGEVISNDNIDKAPDKPGGEKDNVYKVNSIIRLYLNGNGVPVGDLQKSGLTRFKYMGLERPTYEKHIDLLDEIQRMESEGADNVGDVNEMYSLDYDVDFTEANTMRYLD